MFKGLQVGSGCVLFLTGGRSAGLVVLQCRWEDELVIEEGEFFKDELEEYPALDELLLAL